MIFKPRVSLAVSGAVTAALAMGLEAWGKVSPPQAYGFCITCHARDLVNWILARLSPLRWEVSQAGLTMPILTVVGVLGGGFLAATLAHERRVRRAKHPWRSFIAGLLAMNLALVALGCPTRQTLRLGYGDWTALPAALGFALGAVLGVLITKWRAEKIP